MVTGTEEEKFFRSICTRMSVTSPTGMPRNSTGAPRVSPRTDSLNTTSYVCGSPCGGLSAWGLSLEGVEAGSAAAGSRTGAVGGVSKAMPPTRMESSDWVCTVTPLAENDASMPLACQNLVLGVTYWSYGARTNPRMSSDWPSLSSEYAAT